MLDSQSDLAALVYAPQHDPDALLLGFCAQLQRDGFRPVGLVQSGHCHGGDSNLSALLLHTNERIKLLQDLGSCSEGCRLDVGQLLTAGSRVATAIDHGADLVVINRFGRMEREGKGLAFLIEAAIEADIPVVIAVPEARFADWIKFSGGLSIKLACDGNALLRWWHGLARRARGPAPATARVAARQTQH